MNDAHRASAAEMFATLVALAAVSVSPLAFTASATGTISLHTLGEIAIAPALALWIGIAVIARVAGWRNLGAATRLALFAGVVGTAVMEAVRIIGFRVFHGMPGSLPMLLGVLLTNRFMAGPDWVSNLIGWGDHFWNGIGFAFIYFAIFGRQRWWAGLLYALGIATIFMLSPVMNILGAGIFGQDFGPVKFPLTVYLAHAVYGLSLGFIGQRAPSAPTNIVRAAWAAVCPARCSKGGGRCVDVKEV